MTFSPICIFGPVSIHAPVKGRLDAVTLLDLEDMFNPRPREGATETEITYCIFNVCFNPRPREGATKFGYIILGQFAGFNPRPREGATVAQTLPPPQRRVSIHAPVKGRHNITLVGLEHGVFQSTPP